MRVAAPGSLLKLAVLLACVPLAHGCAPAIPKAPPPLPHPTPPVAHPSDPGTPALEPSIPPPANPSAAEPETRPALEVQTGLASFYADRFHRRRTASGIPYDRNELVAAHRSFPFGTLLRVTNLANDRVVLVRVIDRGPFVRGRIIDLSRRAAEELGFIAAGVARVKIEVLEYGSGTKP